MIARARGLFAIWTASVLAIGYGALEFGVRATGFPDAELLGDIRIAARELRERPTAADLGWRVTPRVLTPAARTDAQRLVFLGDSITAGFSG
jgi:hypothetical protein